MIDTQLYRFRIGVAPAIINKILQRKSMQFKLHERKYSRHGDEDLLKKTVKNVTTFQILYLLTILLVITLSLKRPSLLSSSETVYGHGESAQYSLTCADIDVAAERIFAVLCTGLCLYSIGVVHFISILLLIAGIEPNPGPNGDKDKNAKEKSSSHLGSEASDDVSLNAKCISEDTTAVTDLQASSETGKKSEKASNDTTSQNIGRIKSLKRTISKKFKKRKASGDNASVTSETSSHDTTDDIFTADDLPQNVEKENEGCDKLEEAVALLESSQTDIKPQSAGKEIEMAEEAKETVPEDVSHFPEVSGSLSGHSTQSISSSFNEQRDENGKRKRLSKYSDVSRETTASLDLSLADENSRLSPVQTATLHSPSFAYNDYNRLIMHNSQISKDMFVSQLSDIDATNNDDIRAVDFSHSSFFPLSWTENLDEIVDDYMRHPNLQSVAEWSLSHVRSAQNAEDVGLSDIPNCLGEIHHQRLRKLYIAGNNIRTIRESFLKCRFILHLDLSNNRLTTLPDTFRFPQLKTLNLEGNPMFEVPAVLAEQEKLELLKIGSPVTRSIPPRLLSKEQITLEIHLPHARFLCAPAPSIIKTLKVLDDTGKTLPHDTVVHLSDQDLNLNPTQTLENYLDDFKTRVADARSSLRGYFRQENPLRKQEGKSLKPPDIEQVATQACTVMLSCVYSGAHGCTLDLKGVYPITPERIEAIKWIGKKENYKFKNLILSEHQSFCESLGSGVHYLQRFLESSGFHHLNLLSLDRCNLTSIPSLDHCKNIHTVDISYNKLKDMPKFGLRYLRSLNLEGNPIPKIALSQEDLTKVPHLERLSLGSRQTHIIGGTLLERSAADKLIIEVHPDYRDSLQIPLLNSFYKTKGTAEQTDKPSFGNVSVINSVSFLQSSLPAQTSTPVASEASEARIITSSSTSENVDQKASTLSLQSAASCATLVVEEKRLNISKYFMKVKQTMDFGDIQDVHSRYMAMKIVLEEVNCSKNQYALRIVSQPDLYREYGREGLDKFFRHKKLEYLNYLYLSSCDMREIPDLTKLNRLRHLDISNNLITSLAELANKNVRTLVVTGNLFETLDFVLEKVPSVCEVSFGSENCEFISSSIVRKASSGALFLDTLHRNNLLFPPPQMLQNKEQLDEYVNSKELSFHPFQCLEYGKQQKCIRWLGESSDFKFESLDLSGKSDFFQETNFNLDTFFDKSENLQGLKKVILASCGLKCLPRMTSLSQLDVVDVRQNKISVLLDTNLPVSVKKLYVDGNPIECIDVNCERMVQLSELQCGSENTHFLSLSILTKVQTGQFQVVIPLDYHKHIFLPPFVHDNETKDADVGAHCITSDTKQLSHFITNPESYLVDIKEVKNRLRALEWLLENKTELNSRDFVAHPWLFDSPGHFTETGLKNIRSLDVSQCELHTLPNLNYLNGLKNIVLAENNLTGLSTLKHPSLQYIDASRNPIEMIDINFTFCPKVEEMKVGSKVTKFLSIDFLRRLSDGKLLVHLEKEFKSNIMIPPPYIVENDLSPDEVKTYLDNSSFKLCWYIEKDSKKPTLSCNELPKIVSNDRRVISRLSASGQKNLDGTIFEALLKTSTLHVVSHIHLDNCLLTSFNSLQYFSYLTDIDLSGNLIGKELEKFELFLDQLDSRSVLTFINLSQNKLKRIPLGMNKLKCLTTFNVSKNDIMTLQSLESSSLKVLFVEENPFQEVDFDPNKLPVLEKVSFGSPNCQYVNFSILRKGSTSKLCFQLKEEYSRVLLIPPANILADTLELERYVNRKEMNPQIINTSIIQQQIESFRWLTKQRGLPYNQISLPNEVLLCNSIGIANLISLISTMGTVTRLDFVKLQFAPNSRSQRLKMVKRVGNKTEQNWKLYCT